MNGSKVYGVRKIFGSSADEEFEVSFVDHMWNTHGSCEVPSSVAFKSYNSNKFHVPIAKTSWPGFGAFLEDLQKQGKCKLRKEYNSTGGCFVTMVDPATVSLKRKSSAEDELNEQIQRASKVLKKQQPKTVKPGVLQKTEKVSFSLPKVKPAETKKQLSPPPPVFQVNAAQPINPQAPVNAVQPAQAPGNPIQRKPTLKKPSIEEIIEQQEQEKIRDLLAQERGAKWLDVGLIVRLSSHPPRGLERYAREQCVVEDVFKDGFRAKVRVLSLDKRLGSIEQEDLRTVVPGVGGLVRVVNGGFRGADGKIVARDEDERTASVEFVSEMWKKLKLHGGYVATDQWRRGNGRSTSMFQISLVMQEYL